MIQRILISVSLAGAMCALLAMSPVKSAAESQQQRIAQQKNRFGLSSPRPRTEGSLRVASYNILNFFDQVDDPALSGEYDDLPLATSIERCRELARTIKDVDADIVALMEVESLEALTWFRDTFLADAGYTHLASKDVGYYRGIECSVMSRLPITNVEVWPNASLDNVKRSEPGFSSLPPQYRKGLTFQRSPLRVDIRVNENYEITLFALHQKSGGGEENRARREAESLRTIELIDEVRMKDPARNLIVLGDLNAAPWDKSLRVYLEAGFVDTLAHRVIPRWDDFDPAEPNLYKTHESDRVLDYILMNAPAYREYVIGSAFVYGTLFDPQYDWRSDPFPEGYAADHYPVVIDLIPRDLK